MTKLKKFSICLVSGMLLLGTVAFARTGTVKAPTGLVLRETASKTANPITTVSNNETVEILEENGEWYKVKYGNYEGYMFAEYVEAEKIVQENPVVEETPAEEIETPQEQVYEEKSEQTQEEVKTYPQNIVLKSDVKIYLIPSITSKVIVNGEINANITLNYELNDWFNVTYNNTEGWVRKYYINVEVPNEQENTNTEATTPEQNITETEQTNNTVPVENKKGYISASTSANIRETASTSATIINTLTRNTGVTIIGEEGDFYKIQYQDITGYIAKSLISDKPVEVTSRGTIDRQGTENSKQTNEATETSANATEGQKVVDFAKQYLGYSYVYGGTTPTGGFDCTGFTYYVYNACGHSLSRSCSVQSTTGTAVSKENLQAGDLLLFNNGSNGSIGHVGIYIGDGMFIHAVNARRGVDTDTINSGYYYTYYYSARRIIK